MVIKFWNTGCMRSLGMRMEIGIGESLVTIWRLGKGENTGSIVEWHKLRFLPDWHIETELAASCIMAGLLEKKDGTNSP